MKFKISRFLLVGACLFAALLFFFRLPVSEFLSLFFVKSLFSSFERGYWADIILIALLGFFSVWLGREQQWQFLLKLVLFGLIFYSFQRLNNYWEFVRLASWPLLAYWDLFGLGLLLLLPIHLLIHKIRIPEELSMSKDGFVEDNAVDTWEQDHFQRKVTALEISRLIQLTSNRKSFAIGILGEYGSGKTSFMNLINLGLEDKLVLKLTFDPWSAGNPEVIRQEFFNFLAAEIATVDSKISSLMYSYGRKLASFDSRSRSLLNWLGFFRNQGSVQSSGEYQQINNILRAAGRKIVITIDDLDRLYPAEIMEVLKLIRNTADFSNVFYLVGYDKHYVKSAISTLSDGSGIDYLDKIFQLEIPLPKREEDDLLVTLQQHLKKLVSDEHYAVFDNVMIPNGFRSRYEKAYMGILRQGRDVVRFINGFKIIYKLIGEEVDFQCLLLLELIKFRFPTIYDLIYTQADLFLYEQPLRAMHNLYYSPVMKKDSSGDKKKDEVSAFKLHIEKFDWLSPEDVALLDGLFLTLFNGSQYQPPEAKNSISYPLYFEIYFRYRLSHKDLSDKDFKSAIITGNMSSYMGYCGTHGLHKELVVRLMQEDITKNRRHFEQVIRWIFAFGRTFVEKEGIFHFGYESLVDKIYNYHNMITYHLYKSDSDTYKNFINQLFSVAMAPFLFESELIYHLKEKGDSFVLSITELTAHQLSYFNRLAESDHELSEEVMWIFWSARENFKIRVDESGAYKEGWRFEPTLVEKMKVYLAYKDPKEFLKFSIQWDIRNRGVAFIYQEVLDMFEDIDEYRTLIVDNPALDNEIRGEYLAFFDQLATLHFTKYVEMEFHTGLNKLERS